MPLRLPTRRLGSTGHNVSVLALGGVKYNRLPDADAAALVHRALDLGVNYIDTARTYAGSERKIGPVMAERRDQVYLATKSMQRDRDGMASDIERSLRELQTDHIDCMQIHDLRNERELARVTGPNGALKAIEEHIRAGSVRFAGVAGHSNPEILARALREYPPFATVLASLGPIHAAVRPFHEKLIPVARELGVGVLGMKVMGWGLLHRVAEDSLRFVIGLDGVSAALVGMDSVEQLERNVAVACERRALTDAERSVLLKAAGRTAREQAGEAWFLHRDHTD